MLCKAPSVCSQWEYGSDVINTQNTPPTSSVYEQDCWKTLTMLTSAVRSQQHNVKLLFVFWILDEFPVDHSLDLCAVIRTRTLS